jgi:hypothetical protein
MRFWGRGERLMRGRTTLALRAHRALPLLLLPACSPEAREIAARPVSAVASVSAAPSASASERAIPLGLADCHLPAKRPSSFGVEYLQHILPHGGEDRLVGGELTTKDNVCPRRGSVGACTTISYAQMDAVYKAAQENGFCSLRHHAPPRGSTPHYGSRTITIYIGEKSFEVSDSSRNLLDEPSNKRFYKIVDTISNLGSAGIVTKPVP